MPSWDQRLAWTPVVRVRPEDCKPPNNWEKLWLVFIVFLFCLAWCITPA